MNGVSISVVIPVFEERENLSELVSQLITALDKLDCESEVILIDDGSRDGTADFLKEINRTDPRFMGIVLRRNMGKAQALAVGFHQARGGIIVTMDGDLQDDPAEIPLLVQAIHTGADLACGWKYQGKGPLSKSLPSRLFNFVVSRVTGIQLHDMNCPMKAYRREVIEEIEIYGDLHRFIPVLAHQRGFRLAEVQVHNHPRKHGRSKFGFERFANGFFDLFTILLLTRYAQKPLHFFGTIALLLGLTGILCVGGLMINTVMIEAAGGDASSPDRPLFFFGILAILFGAQVFSIGLIGELLTKYFNRTQLKPPIKEVIDKRIESKEE